MSDDTYTVYPASSGYTCYICDVVGNQIVYFSRNDFPYNWVCVSCLGTLRKPTGDNSDSDGTCDECSRDVSRRLCSSCIETIESEAYARGEEDNFRTCNNCGDGGTYIDFYCENCTEAMGNPECIECGGRAMQHYCDEHELPRCSTSGCRNRATTPMCDKHLNDEPNEISVSDDGSTMVASDGLTVRWEV